MARWSAATPFLLVVLSYSTLWTALSGDGGETGWAGNEVDAGSGNDTPQCTPCDAGTEPDLDNDLCNCPTCNCSLITPTDPPSFLSKFFRQTCNCTGFCMNANTSCRQCDAGHYAESRGQAKCEKCPAGKFTDEAGSITCHPCPMGQYSDRKGATQCEDCDVGTFSGKPGAATCTNCSAGTFSNDTGLSECLTCADGHYVDYTGATACFTCGNGTYTNATSGHSKCHTCELGHYCNKTACKNCTACPPGTASQQPDRCNFCQFGSFSPRAGSDTCTPCTVGTICGHLGCDRCYPCEDGYQPSNRKSLISCEPCIPGTFSSAKSRHFCKNCSSGYYQKQSAQPACEICPRGYYCADTYSEPVKCPDDAQCPHGSTEPLFCRNFYTFSESKEKCVPKAVFYITITLVVLFVFLALSLMGCAVYWNHMRKKTKSYEKLPLSQPVKKKPVSEPIYSGH